MTMQPLPKAADADHLTDALRRCGALTNGRVRDVVVENSRPTLLSRIVRLRLTYDGAVDAPDFVILKTGQPDRAGLSDWGRREVEFYAQAATAMPLRVVPRCFEAAWDADKKDWHLLLEDLTSSHMIATAWPLPPTQEQ
jgi:hypothetical protein